MSESPLHAPVLTFRFENSRPVELVDLTASLQAVARRFSRHVSQNETYSDDESVKLYVRRISEGSIIVDLTNLAVEHKELIVGSVLTGVTALTHSNAIVEFAKNIRDGFNYLVGRGPKPEDMPASELKDLSKIVEPVARDSNGSIQITATDGASVQVSIKYNSLEANTIQNRAEKELQDRMEPVQKTFKRVLMYWHQASRKGASRSDKVAIDSISEKPLKVVFDEEDLEIKHKMISGRDNLFNIGFLVDVELLTVRNRPVAYKIIHLYEVLEENNEEEA